MPAGHRRGEPAGTASDLERDRPRGSHRRDGLTERGLIQIVRSSARPGVHYAGTAAQALSQLDEVYAAWLAGVKSLGDAGLAPPCGPAEGPLAGYPMATLVLHINRETLHHGAEIALLRDLYANR